MKLTHILIITVVILSVIGIIIYFQKPEIFSYKILNRQSLFSLILPAETNFTSQPLSIVPTGKKQWMITHSSGLESQLTLWKLNNSKKTELGWIPPNNSCSGWTAKYIYGMDNLKILDDKNKPIEVKCESAKCNGLNCYYISLTNVQAVNIDDYIRLGENSSAIEYQEISTINYIDNLLNINSTLERCDDNRLNCGIGYPEVLIVNSTKLKFGAVDYGTAKDTNYRYVFESNRAIFSRGGQYYTTNGIVNQNEYATTSEEILIQTSDICNQITNNINFSNNCSFNSYSLNSTYYLEVYFTNWYNSSIGAMFIDPSYVISTFTSTNSIRQNITQENNYSHLSVNHNSAPTSFLQVYLPFDTNQSGVVAYDYTGDNDGTRFGSVWTPNGIIGGGEFFGPQTGKYMDVNITVDLSLPRTVSMWIKPSSDGAFRDLAGDNNLRLTSTNKLRYRCNADNTDSTGSVTASMGWTHVAMVYNTTDVWLYINGANDGTETKTCSGTASYRLSSAGGLSFNGTMDEVMFFNNSLTSAQILSIYQNQTARFYGTGLQTFSITNATAYNKINITTNNHQENMTTNMSVFVDYYNGSWFRTSEADFIDGAVVSLSTPSSTKWNISYNFYADSNKFYTPILFAGMTFEVYGEGAPPTDNTPPYFIDVYNVNKFLSQSINEDFNATDETGFGCWKVNNTINFAIDCTGQLTNITGLNAGRYYLNLTINDTSNNINSTVIWVNMSAPSPTSIDLELLNPSDISANFNATQNKLFNVTVKVTCRGGYCGNINVSLDPETMILKTADSENVADIELDGNNTVTEMDSGLGFIKFNLSRIPDRQIIESAGLHLYVISTGASFNGVMGIYRLPNQTWTELTPTSEILNLKNEAVNKTIFTGLSGELVWYNFYTNITNMVREEYNSNNNYVTFVIGNISVEYGNQQSIYNTPTVNIFPDFVQESDPENVEITQKEYPTWSLRPYLNITYREDTNKGLISTVIGAEPFYTTTENPSTITLSQDQSETVVFWVNATGQYNNNYTFWAYVNQTSDLAVSNITSKWNVTIFKDVNPPTFRNIGKNQSYSIAGNYINFSAEVKDDLIVDRAWLSHNFDLGGGESINSSTDTGYYTFGSTTHRGQSFRFSSNQKLNQACMRLYYASGTKGDVYLNVYATSGNNPTGSNLTAPAIINKNDITTSPTDLCANFPEPVDLTGSIFYAVIASSPSSSSTSTYRMRRDGDVYEGRSLVSTNSGGSWSSATSDIVFDFIGGSFIWKNESSILINSMALNTSFVKQLNYPSSNPFYFRWCGNDSNNNINCSSQYEIYNFQSLLVDSIFPSGSILSPPNNTKVNGNITIDGTATDNKGVAYASMQYKNVSVGWTNFSGCDKMTSPYDCVWNTRLFSNSSSGYDIRIIPCDLNGNCNFTAQIKHLIIDRESPIAESFIFYPASQSSISENQTIYIKINTTDGSGAGINSTGIYIDLELLNQSRNTTLKLEYGTPETGFWSLWNLTTRLIGSLTGESQIPFYIYDNATPTNNLLYSSFTVQIDNSNPTYSHLSHTPSTANAGEEVTFQIQAYDNLNLSYYIFSTNITGTWINDTKYFTGNKLNNWGVNISNATSIGTFGYYFIIYDDAGNSNKTSTQYITVLAGSTPLTVNLIAPEDESILSYVSAPYNVTFLYNYTGGTAETCNLFLDDIFNLSVSYPAQETEINFTQNLTLGDHSWFIRCENLGVDYDSLTRSFNISIYEAPPPDNNYPQFSNYQDNNGSLIGSGTGLFNVTVTSTNGTVWLEIDGNNVTATGMPEEDICYQESSNVSTACGGLNTGLYKTAVIGHFGYLYINYSKPSQYNTALWQVSHGGFPSYNVSIPDECYNYNQGTLQLRFFPNLMDTIQASLAISYGQCYNGTWKNITNIYSITSPSHTVEDVNSERGLYDGNWESGVGKNGYYINETDYSEWDSCNNSISEEECRYATLTEEAIIWGVKKHFTADYNFDSSGTYSYKWHSWGNGTDKNYNVSATRSYTVNASDIIPPNITINKPLNQSYSTSEIEFNITATDETAVGVCLFSIDSGITNYTMTNINNEWNYTLSGISDGGYRADFYCNDSSNNLNNSESRSFFIDTTAPSFVSLLNQTIPETNSLSYDIDMTDGGVGTGNFKINDTSLFSIDINTGQLKNSTTLLGKIGLKWILITINDTLNNQANGTIYINVTAVDLSPPYFTSIPITADLEYMTESLSVDFNAEDDTAFGTYAINDSSKFSINSTGGLINITSLAVGTYLLNITINDTSNNINSTIYQVNVQDTLPPTITGIYNVTIYINDSVNEDFNATDLSAVGTWTVNDTTRFSIDNTGQLKNITGLNIGVYYINLTVNDSYNNFVETTIWIQINALPDITLPTVSITEPTATNYAQSSLNLNYTSSDNVGLGVCWYSKNNGVTNSSVQSPSINWSLVSGVEGSNNWIVWCNDTSGNEGSDSVSFTIDTIPPSFDNLANQTILNNQSLNYDIDATDTGVGVNNWRLNDTSKFSISGSGVVTNNSGLNIQAYWLKVIVNDSLQNSRTGIFFVNVTDSVIPDITPPTWTNLRNFTSFSNNSFSQSITATDNVAIGAYSLNQTTNFTINPSTGLIKNATSLQNVVNIFWINISVNDTSGNMISGIFFINVTEAIGPILTGLTANDMYIAYNYENIIQGDIRFNYGHEY